MQLNHFATHLKLTPHCKPTILQFKKKKKTAYLAYLSSLHWPYEVSQILPLLIPTEKFHHSSQWYSEQVAKQELKSPSLITKAMILRTSTMIYEIPIRDWKKLQA